MSDRRAPGRPAANANSAGPDIVQLHADFCVIFANPTRLRLLWALAEGERTVSELAELVALSLTNVSQHLRVLRNKLAVKTRKEGRTVYYRIANPKFVAGARLVREGLTEELKRLGSID